jgi:hypothetical protein
MLRAIDVSSLAHRTGHGRHEAATDERFDRLAMRELDKQHMAMCIYTAKAYGEAFSNGWFSRTNARFGAS